MNFNNKTIIIISQSDWGSMYISKHHYAIQLSLQGNMVYYMNGPDQKEELNRGEIKIEKSKFQHLHVLKHRFSFPYFIMFKCRPLFNYLVGLHIKKIIKIINPSNELIIWSFDLSNTIPLKYFPSTALKIFMPVDEPLVNKALQAAQTANYIFSVTQDIINKYTKYNLPSLNINHGVSDIFFSNSIRVTANSPIQVGLSGNFLRPDIDWPTLLSIISQHQNIVFNFWGSTTIKTKEAKGVIDYSLGGQTNNEQAVKNIETLSNLPNVILHGSLVHSELSAALKKVDIFLICYDINKDQSKGTNYHKIMEYLASGKVIVSNNVKAYQGLNNLLVMTESRIDNKELPDIFFKTVVNIDLLNNLENQQLRIQYASKHTYAMQIKRIEEFINANGS